MKRERRRSSWIPLLALTILVGAAPAARASRVRLDVAMGKPLLLEGRKHTEFLKVGLTGFELKSEKRVPLNVAFVIDRSGSMSGDRIRQAREAAITAVKLLDERDIVSVVTYDSTVNVLVPATRLTDGEAVIKAIRCITIGGNTALFAGVSKGAAEVRKFRAKNRANRVILLSDGQANVGPSSPGELGELGASLGKEGISVTTIGLGLGYNEDLMSQLAKRSDGNHAFVEKPTQLAEIFRKEFGDLLSVVAQEVLVKIECDERVRPVRVLGREAEIRGNKVTAQLNQLYSRQEKFLVLEVELPTMKKGDRLEVAKVDVSYGNMLTKKTDTLLGSASVAFTADMAAVREKTNKKVMVSSVRLVANEYNKQAVALRDQGKIGEAKKILMKNAAFLSKSAAAFDDEKLEEDSRLNAMDAKNLEGAAWNQRRKVMRKMQHTMDMQQSY